MINWICERWVAWRLRRMARGRFERMNAEFRRDIQRAMDAKAGEIVPVGKQFMALRSDKELNELIELVKRS